MLLITSSHNIPRGNCREVHPGTPALVIGGICPSIDLALQRQIFHVSRAQGSGKTLVIGCRYWGRGTQPYQVLLWRVFPWPSLFL